jgi:hypothetical protein
MHVAVFDSALEAQEASQALDALNQADTNGLNAGAIVTNRFDNSFVGSSRAAEALELLCDTRSFRKSTKATARRTVAR